jgi:hypothetical protein
MQFIIFWLPVRYLKTQSLKLKFIILPVVLYGFETWSLTLREEDRLKVLEYGVFRRIFGLKRDEVTGGWRKTTKNICFDQNSIPRTPA